MCVCCCFMIMKYEPNKSASIRIFLCISVRHASQRSLRARQYSIMSPKKWRVKHRIVNNKTYSLVMSIFWYFERVSNVRWLYDCNIQHSFPFLVWWMWFWLVFIIFIHIVTVSHDVVVFTINVRVLYFCYDKEMNHVTNKTILN